MKVLHVLDFSLSHRQSGYSLRSQSILDAQKKIGMTPIVLTRSGGSSDIETINNIPHWHNNPEKHWEHISTRLGAFQLPSTPYLYQKSQNIQFGKWMTHIISKEAPEIIHVASPERNARIAIEMGHHYGLPVVYEVRGLWHESSVAQGWIDEHSDTYQKQHEMHIKAMQDADAVVTLSKVLKAECIREGIEPKKIFVVPNGVSKISFGQKEKNDDLAQALGITPSDVVLGYVGLVRSLEGLDGLLQVCQKLQTQHPNVKILIVGDGRDLNRLKQQAQQLGISNKVIFTGEIPHAAIDTYYTVIDIIVIPRTRNRVTELVTPIKPYEAMAKSKALIVSDVAALLETIIPNETGLTFQANNINDLARACQELIQDEDRRKNMGLRGQKWIQRHRTWASLIKRYKTVYAFASQNKKSTTSLPHQNSHKKIAFYSQHLIGVGHHFRNREIANELSKKHTVYFFDGGRPIPKANLADGITHIALPPLHANHEDLSITRQDTHAKRQETLTNTLSQIKPDVLCIEFFPFCRWSLRQEIISAIETALQTNPNVKIICSLRDIPTRAKDTELQHRMPYPERQDGDALRYYSTPFGGIHHEHIAFNRRYYEEVIPTLNTYFDAVLVHGDPKLSRLEDHFPWVSDINVPVVYTGFVTAKLKNKNRPENAPQNYVLVSAGGGAEGLSIVAPCIEAWKELQKTGSFSNHKMVIFAGAFIDETHFNTLHQCCNNESFILERFTDNFLAWMNHAYLSISRAGYNTCMNLLETKTSAILIPSIAMDDQEFRAKTFDDLGIAKTIHPDHLSPSTITQAITQSLGKKIPDHHIALDGAEKTRKFIESL